MTRSSAMGGLVPGFLPGVALGALVALLALLLVNPAVIGGSEPAALGAWISLNLGHSSWAFAVVGVLFGVHLWRLGRLLQHRPEQRAVVELDQLTDVWAQLFIGIGVIWTAVGMRGALQLALADPEHALADSAGSVLKKLVDGGILLALSTTIVGAVGGYLMRLAKTLCVGAALQRFYEDLQRRDLCELLAAVQRLERAVAGGGRERPGVGAAQPAQPSLQPTVQSAARSPVHSPVDARESGGSPRATG